MSEHPVIFVDLIEVEPWTYEKFFERRRGYEYPQLMYRQYLLKFQPWRWVAKSGDNRKTLARSSERYFNRTDCLHAIELLFGSGSNVYLRQHEQDTQTLRMAQQ